MIRTPEQYVESLNDGRVIYLNGERIPDITKHPHMKGPINRRAAGYRLANDPEWRDLITMEEDGERIMFLWKQPKTAEDLIRRRDVYIDTMRLGGSCQSAVVLYGDISIAPVMPDSLSATSSTPAGSAWVTRYGSPRR